MIHRGDPTMSVGDIQMFSTPGFSDIFNRFSNDLPQN